MKFGLKESFRGINVPRDGYHRLYREHLKLSIEAERLGYDNIWMNEHHFIGDGYSPSVLPLAAVTAMQTERIRIGTSLLLMPLHHPINVAEDGAVVDVLSNGRFDLGVGQGYRPEEFVSYNIPAAERGRRMREGVEIVRQLWSGKPANFSGKFYSVTDAVLDPPVVQQPHPPIWIGGRNRSVVEWAARNGLNQGLSKLDSRSSEVDSESEVEVSNKGASTGPNHVLADATASFVRIQLCRVRQMAAPAASAPTAKTDG